MNSILRPDVSSSPCMLDENNPEIVQQEAARLDNVDRHVQAGREAQQGPGVLRNVRLKKRETHWEITDFRRCANLCKARWIELYPRSRDWRHTADAALRRQAVAGHNIGSLKRHRARGGATPRGGPGGGLASRTAVTAAYSGCRYRITS